MLSLISQGSVSSAISKAHVSSSRKSAYRLDQSTMDYKINSVWDYKLVATSMWSSKKLSRIPLVKTLLVTHYFRIKEDSSLLLSSF